MKSGQDYIPNASSANICGFNKRIHGIDQREAFRYQNEYAGYQGYMLAVEKIKAGEIFYLHNFHSSHSKCKGYAFNYGGFWVCNDCGCKGVDAPWWIIKVMKDGNSFCCVGEGFINLQESTNYAFGDTREEAIQSYGDLMLDSE